MEQISVLQDLLLVFAVGVGVAFALKKVGVPSLAGFIVAGILIGPNALRLIPDVHDVELLAEIGVVLLLFGIGLELSLEKIKRIEEELKNGADFAELAKTESEGPSGPQGGDLGEFTRGQMVSSFEEIAFSLPEGNISGIVETQFGYHIIKMHKRFPESSVPFEDVKESINSYLMQEKSQTNLTDYIENLKSAAKIRIPKFKATE